MNEPKKYPLGQWIAISMLIGALGTIGLAIVGEFNVHDRRVPITVVAR